MDVSMFLLLITVKTVEPVLRLPAGSEWVIGPTTVVVIGASVTSVITLKEIKAEEK